MSIRVTQRPRTVIFVGLVDVIKQLVDESVGNRGAMQNCRQELRHRRRVEDSVDQICRRLPTPAPTSERAGGPG